MSFHSFRNRYHLHTSRPCDSVRKAPFRVLATTVGQAKGDNVNEQDHDGAQRDGELSLAISLCSQGGWRGPEGEKRWQTKEQVPREPFLDCSAFARSQLPLANSDPTARSCSQMTNSCAVRSQRSDETHFSQFLNGLQTSF